MTNSKELQEARLNLVFAFLIASPRTQIRILNSLQTVFPHETKEMYNDLVKNKSLAKFLKNYFDNRPNDSIYSRSAQFLGNLLLRRKWPTVKETRQERYRRKAHEKEVEELMKSFSQDLRDLNLLPKTSELGQKLYGKDIGILALSTIIYRYGELLEENKRCYSYALALFVNEVYATTRDVACFMDPRDVHLFESIQRMIDILNIPSLQSLVFYTLDFTKPDGYAELLKIFPFLGNQYFLEFYAILAILNSSKIKKIDLQKIGPNSEYIEQTLKNSDSTALREMVKLEKNLYMSLLRNFPYFLIFSNRNFREELQGVKSTDLEVDGGRKIEETISNDDVDDVFETNVFLKLIKNFPYLFLTENKDKPLTPFDIIDEFTPEQLEAEIEKSWESWMSLNRKKKEQESTKNKLKHNSALSFLNLFSVFNFKSEILIVFQMVEMLPFLGSQKKLLQTFLLRKLEKLKEILMNFEICNYFSVPIDKISKLASLYSKLEETKREILLLIRTIKQLLLVLDGIEQPFYIYGNLKISLLNLFRLFIYWLLLYLKLMEQAKKILGDGWLKRMMRREREILNSCFSKLTYRLPDKEKKKYFKELIIKSAITLMLLSEVLKNGIFKPVSKSPFQFNRDSRPYIEARINQVPTGSILIFGENVDCETSTISTSEIEEEANSDNRNSQNKIMKRTLDSLESQNFNEIKKSPQKRRIFIRIPSLTRNEQ